jgi:excisionase family DNA binding protein
MARKQRDVDEILKKFLLSPGDLVAIGAAGSEKTIYNLISSGKMFIPSTKFGRGIRFKREDVLAYLEKNEVRPEAE